MNVKEESKKYFGRGGESIDLEVTKVKNSFVYDAEGRKYVDFLGGAGVGSFGWDLKEVESEIRNEDRPSYVYPHFFYKPWVELAKLLAEITPGKLQKSFRTTGGSEAVEAAMQMSMLYTGRKKFLSVEGSYHGNTIGALSLSSSERVKKFPNLLSGCEKINLPLDKVALKTIENKLQTKDYAAFIMEPVIINLGVIIPEKNFMKELEILCNENGTLLVMDEAITGFGRTGKFFATEHYDIKPDILCMAKAISAGHAGIGAVITTPEIAEKVEGEVGLYSSYGWHPVSVDAAIATINYLKSNQQELFSQLEKNSEIVKERFAEIESDNSVEIRIKGLAIAIDLKDEEKVAKLKEVCFDQGLLVNTEKTSIVFLPALDIDEDTLGKGLEIFIKCYRSVK